MARVAKTEKVIEKTDTKKDYIIGVGRRKEAIARVRLITPNDEGVAWGEVIAHKGDILVNGMPIGQYFSGEVSRKAYMEPFRTTNTATKFAVTIRVTGGGKAGQLDAVIHGIARALNAFDGEKYRPILKKQGYLTRDARIRERRKVGTGGKARRQKQSPKR